VNSEISEVLFSSTAEPPSSSQTTKDAFIDYYVALQAEDIIALEIPDETEGTREGKEGSIISLLDLTPSNIIKPDISLSSIRLFLIPQIEQRLLRILEEITNYTRDGLVVAKLETQENLKNSSILNVILKEKLLLSQMELDHLLIQVRY
jgi:hypothetical protein